MGKKKIYLFVFLSISILLSNNVYSQKSPISKGSKLLAGGFMYTSADEDHILTFNPSFSYFLMPGLAVGGKLAFSNSSIDNTESSSWGIGPQILYFFGDIITQGRGKVYPYLGFSAVYTKNSTKEKYWGEWWENNYSMLSISFGGGITYMLTNTAGLFSEFGYQIDRIEDTSSNKINIVAGFLIFLN